MSSWLSTMMSFQMAMMSLLCMTVTKTIQQMLPITSQLVSRIQWQLTLHKSLILTTGMTWLLLLLLCDLIWSASADMMYEQSFMGQGKTVNGTKMVIDDSSSVMCGSVCLQEPQCVAWAFDTLIRVCEVFTELSGMIPAVSPGLKTYLLTTNPIAIPYESRSWNATLAICESFGATMAYFETMAEREKYAKGNPMYLGIHQPNGDEAAGWRNMVGVEILNPGWDGQQPNDAGPMDQDCGLFYPGRGLHDKSCIIDYVASGVCVFLNE